MKNAALYLVPIIVAGTSAPLRAGTTSAEVISVTEATCGQGGAVYFQVFIPSPLSSLCDYAGHVVGPGSFQWNFTPHDAQYFTVGQLNGPGSYSIQIVSTNTIQDVCYDAGSTTYFSVGNDPVLGITSTTTSPADGAGGAIDITVSGGLGPYGFYWSNGETSEDLDSLAPGWYSVIVTDGTGCEAEVEFYLEEANSIPASGGGQGDHSRLWIECGYTGCWISYLSSRPGPVQLAITDPTGRWVMPWRTMYARQGINEIPLELPPHSACGSYLAILRDPSGSDFRSRFVSIGARD